MIVSEGSRTCPGHPPEPLHEANVNEKTRRGDTPNDKGNGRMGYESESESAGT